jgi:hypothetical protein
MPGLGVWLAVVVLQTLMGDLEIWRFAVVLDDIDPLACGLHVDAGALSFSAVSFSLRPFDFGLDFILLLAVSMTD